MKTEFLQVSIFPNVKLLAIKILTYLYWQYKNIFVSEMSCRFLNRSNLCPPMSMWYIGSTTWQQPAVPEIIIRTDVPHSDPFQSVKLSKRFPHLSHQWIGLEECPSNRVGNDKVNSFLTNNNKQLLSGRNGAISY